MHCEYNFLYEAAKNFVHKSEWFELIALKILSLLQNVKIQNIANYKNKISLKASSLIKYNTLFYNIEI